MAFLELRYHNTCKLPSWEQRRAACLRCPLHRHMKATKPALLSCVEQSSVDERSLKEDSLDKRALRRKLTSSEKFKTVEDFRKRRKRLSYGWTRSFPLRFCKKLGRERMKFTVVKWQWNWQTLMGVVGKSKKQLEWLWKHENISQTKEYGLLTNSFIIQTWTQCSYIFLRHQI